MITVTEARKILSEEAIRLRGREYFTENHGKFGMSYGESEGKYFVFWGLDLKETKRSSDVPVIDETIPWDGVTHLELDMETGDISVVEMY